MAWLEKTLAAFPGTVVAVTHDRYRRLHTLKTVCGLDLLPPFTDFHRAQCARYYVDKVCGWILELSGGKGIPFEVRPPSTPTHTTEYRHHIYSC